MDGLFGIRPKLGLAKLDSSGKSALVKVSHWGSSCHKPHSKFCCLTWMAFSPLPVWPNFRVALVFAQKLPLRAFSSNVLLRRTDDYLYRRF